MSALPTIAFALVAVSAGLQAIFLFRRDRAPDPASHWILLGAAAALAAVAVERSIVMGFPALTGTFESLVFYAILLCLLCLAYRLQRRIPYVAVVQFGATVTALALLAVASSPLAPKAILAPIPALRSGWLVAHVALSFIGEAFFVASFVSSIAWLVSKDESPAGEPGQDHLHGHRRRLPRVHDRGAGLRRGLGGTGMGQHGGPGTRRRHGLS